MSVHPLLEGCYHCFHETVHTGYNTDLEEMDSWEEQEDVYLMFSSQGEVRALIADENASWLRNQEALESKLKECSQLKANGKWEVKEIDGRSGYLITLKLSYNVPVFWQSTTPETILFLEQNPEGFSAQRFYPMGGWGQQSRQLVKK